MGQNDHLKVGDKTSKHRFKASQGSFSVERLSVFQLPQHWIIQLFCPLYNSSALLKLFEIWS